ncbi:MAG: hypothetical protein JST89_14690 [Cyanobacteria bacterium SZAS-4]|nr:hypothetical protein [Cyanobacteria bacterium SZAS-4]
MPITDLWQVLLEIIGKSEEDPLFVELLAELGAPKISTSGRRNRSFDFPRSGLSIDLRDKVVKSVFFHYGSAAVKEGSYQPYSGNLAIDVNFGDAPSDVANKLGMQPSSSEYVQGRTKHDAQDLWQTFKFGKVEGTFIFKGGNNLLGSVSLHEPTPTAPNNYTEVEQPQFFDNFSKSALLSLQCARAESRSLHHNFVGTEHILLGMLLSGDNLALQALKFFKVTPEKVRHEIINILGDRKDDVGETIAFTPLSRKILLDSKNKANYFESTVVEDQHILLAMLKDAEGVGPRVLENLKVNFDCLEESVWQLIEKHRS